jgi:hypothetical protein
VQQDISGMSDPDFNPLAQKMRMMFLNRHPGMDVYSGNISAGTYGNVSQDQTDQIDTIFGTAL